MVDQREESVMKYVVVDCEAKPNPLVLRRFRTELAASEWIGSQNEDKVLRGGYGIDGPDRK